MDFTLTEDQADLAALAERLFAERATTARVEQVEGTAERFDRDLWRELAATGLLGVTVPEVQDGLGLGAIEHALVCEQLGRAVAPVPYVWTTVAAATLAAYADEEQRARWLPGVAAGETVLAVGLPQSGAGVRVESGRMSGSLLGVAFAHVADAVLVPVDDGVWAFDPAADGVTLRPGTATNREVSAELTLDGAAVERVGGEGVADALWQRLVVALAAVQAGVTREAVRLAADYTSQREQFGKPLSTFQGVSHKAADAYIDAAAIRATMLQAAWRLDQGDDATLPVLTAVWWAAEAGQHCVHLTQHIHGGIGADVTYPAHRYFLWAKQIELMLGGAPATLALLGDALVTADAPGDELALPLG
jgi:acyl-CoA dehydrogenase